MEYRDIIKKLILGSTLQIDPDIQICGRVPTTVSSEFITNKEQGDWAERIVFETINRDYKDYVAVRYGRSESLSAGEDGFREFYTEYQNELNTIGKKPDILIFRRCDYYDGIELSEDGVKQAVCAFEVRSSSFLVSRYNLFMSTRTEKAIKIIEMNKSKIFNDQELAELLYKKNIQIYEYLKNSNLDTYTSLSFRCNSWSSTEPLRILSKLLKEIRDNIRIIQRRDYLSITPKLEDIALVNRWIQVYNVPHYYIQVFFDKGFIISFKSILEISSDQEKEGKEFSIETDIKNQGKTTIKINVGIADTIIKEIEMPTHCSQMKELDRGRLLFYVKFVGGKGYLDSDTFGRILQ